MRASTKLKKLLETGKTFIVPGAYDGISARIIQNAGAEIVYATGGGIARSTGIPDMGLMSLKEITDRLETMVDAIDLPLIADMDTGYGNALNARQGLKAFERVGVAGFHLEDQVFPKRCGHYEGKAVVPVEEFCSKIKAIRDALTDDDMTIIARTDSLAGDGVDAAIERMHKAMEAGATMAFVEAPTTMEEIEKIAKELPYPKLLNMFWSGKTPVVPRDKLEELGFNLVIVPSDLQRIAIQAMQDAAECLLRDGHTEALKDRMASFQDREAAVNTEHYMELDERYAI